MTLIFGNVYVITHLLVDVDYPAICRFAYDFPPFIYEGYPGVWKCSSDFLSLIMKINLLNANIHVIFHL